MSVSHYQAAAEQLIERIIPQYNVSKTMKRTDVKQLLLRNLLFVGLRHKDVLKQCQTMKSDACTAEHLLNLARQAEYRDTTAVRLTKTVTSNAPTSQDNSESSLHQIKQRRQKIDQQDGSSNSRRCRWCGGSRLCRRSKCPARDTCNLSFYTLRKYAAKIAQEESTSNSHCTSLKMTKMTKMKKEMKMMLRQYTVSKLCTTRRRWNVSTLDHSGSLRQPHPRSTK